MDKLIFEHSEEWMEKLAWPLAELSAAEREAITTHIAHCPDCHGLLTDYAILNRLAQLLGPVDLSPRGSSILPQTTAGMMSQLDSYEDPVTPPRLSDVEIPRLDVAHEQAKAPPWREEDHSGD